MSDDENEIDFHSSRKRKREDDEAQALIASYRQKLMESRIKPKKSTATSSQAKSLFFGVS